MGRRIIFTVSNDLSFDQRMHRICNSMSVAGYDIVLIGRQLKQSKPLEIKLFIQTRLQYLIFSKGKLFYLEYSIRLFFFLLFQRFDAICSIDLDTSVPGILACKLKSKPHVFDAHELFSHTPEVQRRPGIQKIWLKIQRFTFNNSTANYTVGSAIALWFQEKYQKPVSVLRNMPIGNIDQRGRFLEATVQSNANNKKDDPMVASSNKIMRGSTEVHLTNNISIHTLPHSTIELLKNRQFILYQGALNEGRGLEILIRAMHQIPCDLVLAGEGDLSQSLGEQVSSENLQHKIFFLGMLDPSQLPALASLAYLGFNVSENAGLSYYLSLNNKFFDYVQAHLPSLVNPFPEYEKLLGDFQVGLLTEPTVESIVRQANEMLTNQKLYQKIQSNCKDAARNWIWKNEEPQLIEIYKTLFSKPRLTS